MSVASSDEFCVVKSRRNRKDTKTVKKFAVVEEIKSASAAAKVYAKKPQAGMLDPLALYVLSLLAPIVTATAGMKAMHQDELSSLIVIDGEKNLRVPLTSHHNNHKHRNNKWVLFSSTHDRKCKGLEQQDYMSFLQPTKFNFSTYSEFLHTWETALSEVVQQSTSIQVFKEGITPVWEDPQNVRGGKFSIGCEGREQAINLFLQIALGVATGAIGKPEDISGVVLSFRKWGGTVSVWNTNAADRQQVERVRARLQVYASPLKQRVCFHSHQRSMTANNRHLSAKQQHSYKRQSSQVQQSGENRWARRTKEVEEEVEAEYSSGSASDSEEDAKTSDISCSDSESDMSMPSTPRCLPRNDNVIESLPHMAAVEVPAIVISEPSPEPVIAVVEESVPVTVEEQIVATPEVVAETEAQVVEDEIASSGASTFGIALGAGASVAVAVLSWCLYAAF